MNSSRRPPQCVAVQARCHWLMGGSVLLAVAAVYFLTRNSEILAMSRKGYALSLGLGLLYVLTGVLVWSGIRLGRYLNYACSLIYLTRPRLGLRLWSDMRSPEFQAHFAPRDDHSEPVSRRGTKPPSGDREIE